MQVGRHLYRCCSQRPAWIPEFYHLRKGRRCRRDLEGGLCSLFSRPLVLIATWSKDNTYPGCGCDVPAHWYSLSTDPNPSWNRHYASQRELHAYWRSVFDKHALRDHTVFNTIVVRSEWDEDLQRWTVWLQRDGRETIEHAEILLYAIGGFMEPMWPKDIKGMEAFKGDFWHSALWKHDVNLKGKRVGVIGNGCSASVFCLHSSSLVSFLSFSAQLVPAISHEPSTEVINFCRTPQWFVPMVRVVLLMVPVLTPS